MYIFEIYEMIEILMHYMPENFLLEFIRNGVFDNIKKIENIRKSDLIIDKTYFKSIEDLIKEKYKNYITSNDDLKNENTNSFRSDLTITKKKYPQINSLNYFSNKDLKYSIEKTNDLEDFNKINNLKGKLSISNKKYIKSNSQAIKKNDKKENNKKIKKNIKIFLENNSVSNLVSQDFPVNENEFSEIEENEEENEDEDEDEGNDIELFNDEDNKNIEEMCINEKDDTNYQKNSKIINNSEINFKEEKNYFTYNENCKIFDNISNISENNLNNKLFEIPEKNFLNCKKRKLVKNDDIEMKINISSEHEDIEENEDDEEESESRNNLIHFSNLKSSGNFPKSKINLKKNDNSVNSQIKIDDFVLMIVNYLNIYCINLFIEFLKIF